MNVIPDDDDRTSTQSLLNFSILRLKNVTSKLPVEKNEFCLKRTIIIN